MGAYERFMDRAAREATLESGSSFRALFDAGVGAVAAYETRTRLAGLQDGQEELRLGFEKCGRWWSLDDEEGETINMVSGKSAEFRAMAEAILVGERCDGFRRCAVRPAYKGRGFWFWCPRNSEHEFLTSKEKAEVWARLVLDTIPEGRP